MIQVKNIIKNYTIADNVVNALKDVSLNFRDNEFVSILGPSGCGKTTLLNVLGGLDRYDDGEIVINGKSTKEFKDKDWDIYRNHYIGFIFQSYNLIPHLTVLENVEIALSIAGLSKREKREKSINALTRVGLQDQLHKKPNQLSGGQMQRVAIARAIVNNPKIILADEPTGALDSETSVQIMNLLQEIAGEHLIIMVTHNQDIANDYSNRIISLLDGVVTNDTNPYEPSQQELNEQQEYIQLEQQEEKQNKKQQTKQKTSMGFWTAITLSFKNLLTK
ncbi:MAG: ABC transporter ATP-binding protein, partial [Clostridia bacterium]|nr:ABC transporter ATP-binding protein [Clostridia bacterium]